jgi:crotonobetainyl-CoA:carnitine CoA-transferase CaiB-like acyl-CoA transferase
MSSDQARDEACDPCSSGRRRPLAPPRNRSAYFNKLNRNKRAVCLDLSKPAGRDVFLKLVTKADVVLENNSARVMAQLGLAYEHLRAVNPGIIMCSMSGFGSTGPERNYSAYGSTIETLSGLASLLGYGPEFFGTGSYADPSQAPTARSAMLAALHARRRTGEGQWLDMALLEAVGPFFAQQFLEYTVQGHVPQPMGNRSPRYSPQNVYPTFGRDCWLALTVRDEQDWTALCAVIGRREWAADPALRTVEGRRACETEIEGVIRQWAAQLDHITAAESLQAAGVPAAPVMPNWEILSDNHLNERRFFVPTRHPEAGTFPYPGFPWRFEKTARASGCRADVRRAQPRGVPGTGRALGARIEALYERHHKRSPGLRERAEPVIALGWGR